MTTTTSSITLLGGQQAEFQFDQSGSSTTISLQVTDASGAVLQPLESFDEGSPIAGINLATLTRIDSYSAAALQDGGFAFVDVKHTTASAGGDPDGESLSLFRLTANGQEAAFGGTAIGTNLPVTGIGSPDLDFTSPPTIQPLSGDHFAVFYEGLDGTTTTHGMELMLDDSLNATNVLFASRPTSILVDGAADLQVGFANGDQVLVAGAGHEVVTAVGAGADTLIGDAAADALAGALGNDSIAAGAGDDTLTGGAGQGYLRGEDGNDFIVGGAGFDDINGNKGDDTISGGPGDDWLVGGQGSDSIASTGGAAILYGNIGNDTLSGGAGDEIIRGGQGDDLLSGGAGNDFLSGDRGGDTLTGGAGADIFSTFTGAGSDVVTDFNAAEGDRVQIADGSHFTVAQAGADVVVTLDAAGDELVLRNVQLSTLPSDWIVSV